MTTTVPRRIVKTFSLRLDLLEKLEAKPPFLQNLRGRPVGSSAHLENHCSIGRVNAIACDLIMREVWTGLMTESGIKPIRQGKLNWFASAGNTGRKEKRKNLPAFYLEGY